MAVHAEPTVDDHVVFLGEGQSGTQRAFLAEGIADHLCLRPRITGIHRGGWQGALVVERATSERPDDMADAVIKMSLQAVGRVVAAGLLLLVEPLPKLGDAPDGLPFGVCC